MVKASGLIETIMLGGILYKDMDIVLVKYPNNKTEKHYYKVDDKGKILVYKEESEVLKNPEIKGTGMSYDSKTKKNIYKWEFGSAFAYPLFSDENIIKSFLSDEDVNQIFDLGREFEKLNMGTPTKNLLGNVPMLIMALLAIGLVSLALNYAIADKLGVIKTLTGFLGGG